MMTAQMGVFALGASFAEAMPVLEAILAVLIGNFAMIFVLVLIGDIGVEHGINFAGYLRVPFGIRGSYLPLFFLTYLPVVGAILAPVAGIMIADYYFIRKRKLDIAGIFDPNGRFT